MKKIKVILALLLVFSMLLSQSVFVQAANPIPSDAIHIRTQAQLAVIGGVQSVGKYYVLDNDIDLVGEWVPINNFHGTLDGRGNVINNLYILASSNRQFAGLFERLYGATIKNLGINIGLQGVNANCSVYMYDEHNLSGGLAGLCIGSIISCCYVTGGSVSITYPSYLPGGIAGGLIGCFSGIIQDCYTTVNVSVYSHSPYAIAGGIIGEWRGSDNDIINNCYSTGNISANGNSSSNAGGIVGGYSYYTYNVLHLSPTNCYRLSTQVITGDNITNDSTPLTPTQMKDKTSFIGWDFNDVWNIKPGINNGYPYMKMFNNDTDEDGLLDKWEVFGIWVEGEFLNLPAMGANPDKPDIFIEVDWMYRQEGKTSTGKLQKEKNLKPSEKAMRMVHDQFAAHGINLHIDVGRESTMNFATGEKWNNLSEGNSIDYTNIFNLGAEISGITYPHWNEIVNSNNNFIRARRGIFHHALFVNRYDENRGRGNDSSGISYGIPGQYFIVANVDGRFSGDIAVAGTFMHELGHNLGLCHGGIYSDRNDPITGEPILELDHTNDKPNYLSIMNYLFQLEGLVVTDPGKYPDYYAINYSDYELPTLDEEHLYELRQMDSNGVMIGGIDPNNETAGTNLGTKFKIGTELKKSDIYIFDIAGKSINFNRDFDVNGNEIFSKTPIEVNLNMDFYNNGNPIIGKLKGSLSDWKHITYKGGEIGASGAYLDNPFSMPNTSKDIPELSASEIVDILGPIAVIANQPNQKLFVKVENNLTIDRTFTLSLATNGLINSEPIDVYVNANDFVIVAIPFVDTPNEGQYEVVLTFYEEDFQICIRKEAINVYNYTIEGFKELKEAIETERFDFSKEIAEQYLEIINKLLTNTDDTVKLIDLLIPNVILNPAFNADTLKYTTTVTENISSVVIVPKLNTGSSAVVLVNGVPISKSQSGYIANLKQGLNTITVTVSENGKVSTTYTIEINRGNNSTGDNKVVDWRYTGVAIVIGHNIAQPSVSESTIEYDKTKDGDIVIRLSLGNSATGGYSLHGLKNSSKFLIKGTDYTFEGNEITIKASYLKQLKAGEQTISFLTNSSVNPKLTIKIINTAP